MPWILVAESEGRFAERIRDGLAADGWQVEIVASAEAADAAVARHSPELVLVSSELAGAAEIAGRYSRRSGGCGVVALLPEIGGGEATRDAADDSLSKPFTDQDLRLTVRRLSTSGRAPRTPPAAGAGEHRMTSQDLFGDVLAEMGEMDGSAPGGARAAPAPAPPATPPAPRAPAPPPRPAPSAAARSSSDVDKVLEKTLSGLLQKGSKPKPAARKRDAGVDDLLSKTLSDLEPTKRPATPRPAPPRPAPPPEAEPAFQAMPPLPDSLPEPAPPPSAETPPEAAAGSGAPREPRTGGVDELLERVRQMPPRVEPKRASRDFDFSELDVLAHPKAHEPGPAAGEPLATQRVPVPSALLGAPASNQFGQYTLLDRIAVGGMAEVWKARMKGVEGFQKTVAIKKILPHLTDSSDFVTMFVDEAKLAAQLNHNNIIHIYDLGKIGDDYYIAMEFVDGRDLRSILNLARERDRPLPMGLALLVASRLASALDYAHRKRDFEGRELGLVHRDVSPQNVLISFEGDIKLCDFGIVKAVTKTSKTQMGALKGKLQYMSPEQAWGRTVDARSDIFSLGSLLFEMLTGRRLFAGESEMSVLDAVREGRIQAPRDLDPRIPLEVNNLVLRALAKEPGDRYESAGAMQREIDSILTTLQPPTTPLELAGYLKDLVGPSGAAEAAATARPATASGSGVEPAPPPALAPVPEFQAIPPLERSRPAAGFDSALEAAPARGRNLVWMAIGALAVLAVAGYLLFGRKPAPAAGPETPPAATTESAPEAGGAEAPAATGTESSAATTSPADVAKIVDDEVRKHQQELKQKYQEELDRKQKELAAAKAPTEEPKTAPPTAEGAKPKPETAKPNAETAPSGAAAPAPVAAAPAAAVPSATTAAAPASSSPPATTSPAPTTSAPATTPPTAAPATAAANASVTKPSATPAPPPLPRPTTKEGDLVQPGPGVTIPVLVSIDKPEYPPIARRMKVEGTVILSLLVDENGRVLEVRLERGVQQNVGINEAAEAAARSAKFRPATKDGVRVKIWYQLTIPFKL
jgi:TonB family protein